MARETNNRGLRGARNNGSGGLFGLPDMYRGIASPRMFRISRPDLLPTIPSGPEIDETYDTSQEANTTYGSNDSLESFEEAPIKSNANIQTARTHDADKSVGIRPPDGSVTPTRKNVASQYQSYASTNSSDCALAELQSKGTSEKYACATLATIPETRNPRFHPDGNSSYTETSNTSIFENSSTDDNDIGGTPTNLGYIQNPQSCEGSSLFQKDAREVFPGSGQSSAFDANIGRKFEAAGGAREILQGTGKHVANERSRVEISGTSSLYNSSLVEVHRESLNVCRNDEENGRFDVIVKGPTPAKAELDRYSSPKTTPEYEIMPRSDSTRVGNCSETCNTFRNQEFSEEMNENAESSALEQIPAIPEIPCFRAMNDDAWCHVCANQSPNDRWVAPSGFGCAGTCGGGGGGGGSGCGGCGGGCGRPDGCSGRYVGASCAPAFIPRGVGFPKHARMFGASMPYKNKGFPGDVGNCGISLLPRVCRSACSRHGACHRGYVHPIIRTIADSRLDGIPRCQAKARRKKRRQSTDTADRFPQDITTEEESNSTSSTYESVESDSAWPTPMPGVLPNALDAAGTLSALYEESRDNELEPTPQKSQPATKKGAKMKKRKR